MKIYAPVSIDVNDLAENITRSDAYATIIEIEKAQQDWTLTTELAEYFIDLILDNKGELGDEYVDWIKERLVKHGLV